MYLAHLLIALLSSSIVLAHSQTTITRHPLPTEKDGVSPDNAVINAAATVTSSCWTKPSGAPILGWDSNYTSGQCQVCIIVNGTGTIYYDPFFEIWVRDAHNQAIGGIGPQPLVSFDKNTYFPNGNLLAVSDDISFATAAKQLYMATVLDHARSEISSVQMAWGFRPPKNFWDLTVVPDPAIMLFHLYSDPNKTINQPLQNCVSTRKDYDGAVSYYQCSFHCA